jgi:LPXTG-motif cell wall-anchored protein
VNMDTNTLLIIIVLVLLLGGGGIFWRGRRV